MTNWFAGMAMTAARLNSPPVAAGLVTGSVANSNLETIIGTFTVPILSAAVGQGFEWKIACTCGGTASPTLTVRMRVGSAAGPIICSGANPVTSASAWFSLEGWLLFTAVGAGGTFQSLANISESFNATAGTPLAQGWYATNGTAWNTTIANPIYVTAQFSAANAANTAATVAGNLYAQ